MKSLRAEAVGRAGAGVATGASATPPEEEETPEETVPQKPAVMAKGKGPLANVPAGIPLPAGNQFNNPFTQLDVKLPQ